MTHRHNIAIIFIAIAGFLVLFIFFIKIINLTDSYQPTTDKQQQTTNNLNLKSEIYSPQVNFTDPVFGEKDAANTIVVYSDFQCPYSKQAAGIFGQLVADYPQKVKIIWKDFPNTQNHPLAFLAAQAARCAKEQNKFWEYHNLIFQNQEQLSPSLFIQIADELNLNKAEFADCLQNEKTKTKVQSNLNEALALKLDGTPALFINGTLYNGKISYESLEEMIK